MSVETLKINITADNKAAVAAFGQVQKSAFNLKEELMKYQSLAFTEKDTQKVAAYNRKIQELGVQLKQVANIGKEGFNELGVAIDKNGTGALGKAFSGLRQIAYILPGIGIAGIFNLAFEAIGKAADELGIFAKKEDEAAKAAAEFNKEMLKQREGAEAEVSHLKALEDVASNSSISLKKRMQAVKELREQYPAYFKDLTDEQILTGNITAATDSLTQAIYKRAEARAREADIAKKATQVFENQQKIEELNKKIQEAGVRKSQAGPLQLQGGFGQGIPESVKIRVEENDLLKERDKLLTENSALQLQIVSSQLKVNEITAQTIDLDEKDIKNKKEKLTEAEKYAKFLKHFEGKMQEQFNASINLTAPKSEKEKAEGITPMPRSTDFNRGVDNYKKQIDDIDKANKQALENARKYAQVASNAFGNLFDQMRSGMSIGDALGKMFEDLANEIAKAAIKALVFKVILDVFSGGVSEGASGVGLGSLFKNILGGGTGGLGKGFAAGGTASGPTSGYLALLHGTEHIVRPDQMNKIVGGAAQMGAAMGGGAQRIIVEGRISGNDIWLSKQRTDYSRSLTT